MYEYVLLQLQATKGQWAEIAEASGVPLRTIEKVARRETEDPRVSTVQRLYDHFRKAPDVPPPDPPRAVVTP